MGEDGEDGEEISLLGESNSLYKGGGGDDISILNLGGDPGSGFSSSINLSYDFTDFIISNIFS